MNVLRAAAYPKRNVGHLFGAVDTGRVLALNKARQSTTVDSECEREFLPHA